MTAHDVTADDFDSEVLGSAIPVIVDFWAPWCGPCRALTPILDSIAAERAGAIRVVKVNADDEPELAERYGVSSIPTLKVFVHGSVVKTITGARPKPALEFELAQVIPA